MQPAIIQFIFLFLCSVQAYAIADTDDREKISYTVCRHYKHRTDGGAGREILLTYNGTDAKDITAAEIVSAKGKETVKLNGATKSFSLILPDGIGVAKNDTVQVKLVVGKNKLSKQIIVPALRQWTVYIYPHSHVDIGYTNTQANVEVIHKRNLEQAILLAEKTKNYPEGARFLWNPEVTWPIERYLHSSKPQQQKDKLMNALKNGAIAMDAGYINTNTSAGNDEEIFELFRYGKEMEKQTGRRIETMVQVDIPGVAWGVVSVASQLKIPYILALFNGYDRTGYSHELNFRPFWWVAPDGKSKVLFLQPGSYNPGALIKGKYFWPLMAGQMDTTKLMQLVKTDHPRQNFIDSYLAEKLPELERADYYPYDIFPMTWCMADNTPIDADLPEAVKSWNEEFAYPRLVICSATQMMRAFDEKYGEVIPELKGDFTEYWTDGLGSNAKYTGMNREVKERLTQTETLWSMLHPDSAAPRAEIQEAWRNVLLSTEHTWAYMAPEQEPICSEILGVKFGYFNEAARKTGALLKTTLPTGEGPIIAVFNTLSWNHSGVVKLSAEQSKRYRSVTDATGNEVLSQRLSTGELAFMATDIPALGYAKYKLSDKKSKKAGTFVNGHVLDNGVVKLAIDPETGDISTLMYEGKEYVDKKATIAVNSYRYLRGGDTPGKAAKATNIRISIKENGTLLATLRVESDAEGCNSLTREVTVFAGMPDVELVNTVDKIAIKDKEGIHFGFAFNIPNPKTRVDIPWGVMELEKDQLAAGNRNWIAFQRWLNISNEEQGITWCAPNACTFESGDLTANVLGGAYESPLWVRRLQPSATIYSWALNNHWHTNFSLSQEGKIVFRYHILPHATAFNAGESNRFGMERAQPLIATPVKDDFQVAGNLSIQTDPTVATSIVKTINGGQSTLIRLRSVSEKEQEARFEWKNKAPKSLHICNFHEEAGTVVKDNKVKIPAMGLITLRAEW